MEMDFRTLFQKKKRTVYVSYDHHGDGEFYDDFNRMFSSLCKFARDNSLVRELDTEDAEGFLLHLSEGAMSEAGCVVVLCGARTHLRKFVDWEIKAALDRKMGLLAVILPTNPLHPSGQPTLPDRLQDNFDGGFAAACRWKELAESKIDLTRRIEFAASRPASLIDNSRPLRQSNG